MAKYALILTSGERVDNIDEIILEMILRVMGQPENRWIPFDVAVPGADRIIPAHVTRIQRIAP